MSMLSLPDRARDTALEAARAAGDVLVRGFSSLKKGAREKGHPYNPVTMYDRQSEDVIIRILEAEGADHGILSEESAEVVGTSGLRWIIDPLDGTNNFLAGIPHFAVSIALAAGDEVVFGCVHDPIRNETSFAVRGGGASLNGEPIHVSARDTLDGSVLGVGLSHHPSHRIEMIAGLQPFLQRAGVLRTLGSAVLDLAYVAAGRIDAVWYVSLNAWDIAAGGLLVEEAGGRLTDLTGAALQDPRSGIAASNGRIHDAFLHALG
jgi:myo-inositol-1(or 4)-monophosphatase